MAGAKEWEKGPRGPDPPLQRSTKSSSKLVRGVVGEEQMPVAAVGRLVGEHGTRLWRVLYQKEPFGRTSFRCRPHRHDLPLLHLYQLPFFASTDLLVPYQ